MAVTRGLLRPTGGEGSIRSFVVIVTLISMIIFVYYKTKYPTTEISKLDLHALNLKNTALHDNLKVCMEETEKLKTEREQEMKQNAIKEEAGSNDKEKIEKLLEENKRLNKQLVELRQNMYECTSQRDEEANKAQDCKASLEEERKKSSISFNKNQKNLDSRGINENKNNLDSRGIDENQDGLDENVEMTKTSEAEDLYAQTTEATVSKDRLITEEKSTKDPNQKLIESSNAKINIESDSNDEFKKKIIGISKNKLNNFNNKIKNTQQMTTGASATNVANENILQDKNSQLSKMENNTSEDIDGEKNDVKKDIYGEKSDPRKDENQGINGGSLNKHIQQHKPIQDEKKNEDIQQPKPSQDKENPNDVSEKTTSPTNEDEADKILFNYKVSNIKKRMGIPLGNNAEGFKREGEKQEDRNRQQDKKTEYIIQQNRDSKLPEYNKEHQSSLKYQMNKPNDTVKQPGYQKQSHESFKQYQRYRQSKHQYYRQGRDDSGSFRIGAQNATNQQQVSNNQNIKQKSNFLQQLVSKKPDRNEDSLNPPGNREYSRNKVEDTAK